MEAGVRRRFLRGIEKVLLTVGAVVTFLAFMILYLPLSGLRMLVLASAVPVLIGAHVIIRTAAAAMASVFTGTSLGREPAVLRNW